MAISEPNSAAGIALRGTIVTPLSDGSIATHQDGVIVAERDGRIRYAGAANGAKRVYRGPLRDVRPNIIAPGLVDLHTHYPQTRIIGRATGPLLDWLKTSVYPEEARFTRAAYAHAVAAELTGRLLRAGTTCVMAFSSSSPSATGILFEHLAARGLRGTAGLTLMDRRCPEALRLSPDKALKAARRLIMRWHEHDGGRLRFAVTPRFALSCSRPLLRAAGRLAADHDVAIQTHLGETLREEAATLKAHRYAKHYLDVYEQAGLVNKRTVFAHAIHLDERQWARLADLGASVAHCPDSNFFLGSGRMPLAKTLSRGIRVGLGSDVAAGRTFCIRQAATSAYDSALSTDCPVTPEKLFTMATLGGAQALGLGAEIGSLEVGKQADLIVVRGRPGRHSQEELLAHFLFDSAYASVQDCYVGGRRLDLDEAAAS